MTVPELIEEARQVQRTSVGSIGAECIIRLIEAVVVLQGDRDNLREALERLASMEGFEGAGWIGGGSFPERELQARGKFAREALASVFLPDEETQPENLGGT